MDKERLKLIVRNLKQLVDALESEVHSDVDAYKNSHAFSSPDITYDEAWDDDEFQNSHCRKSGDPHRHIS